jgi:hypothetical protein
LLGFAQKVKERLVIAVLPELVSPTWNNILFFDEELDHIRALLQIDHVQAFYMVQGQLTDVDRLNGSTG